MSGSGNISLLILTPERTLFEKKVEKVTLPGSKGNFMVLRNHAPIISSLEAGDVTFESSDGKETVRIAGGFVEVYDNKVTVCAEI